MQLITPKHRGIPNEWVYEGIKATDLPNTMHACHAWMPFSDRIMAAECPMSEMFNICKEHFSAPEQSYLWVAALFPVRIKTSMANRMLGCGKHGARTNTSRSASAALSGLSKSELRDMPWKHSAPPVTRTLQFARRSRITGDLVDAKAPVVEYLNAVFHTQPEYYWERIYRAVADVVTDSFQFREGQEAVHLRLFLTLTYMCAGRPDVVLLSTLPDDDRRSNRIHWQVAVKSGDTFFNFSGIYNQ